MKGYETLNDTQFYYHWVHSTAWGEAEKTWTCLMAEKGYFDENKILDDSGINWGLRDNCPKLYEQLHETMESVFEAVEGIDVNEIKQRMAATTNFIENQEFSDFIEETEEEDSEEEEDY